MVNHPKRSLIRYEWDVLELDGNGDIIEHHHCDTLAQAVICFRQFTAASIELVRDVGNDANGLTDRQWAEIERGRLPTEFSEGAMVPKRFHAECLRAFP